MASNEKTVVCRNCGKIFTVDFDSEKVFCISCGTDIPAAEPKGSLPPPPPEPLPTPYEQEGIPEPAHEGEKEKKEQEIFQCPKCNAKTTETNKIYSCSTCGADFCNSCQGLHIPPVQAQISAKVLYKYRVRPSTVWHSDAHTFTDHLPSPLCSSCYDSEALFENAISRLKTMIKNWRVEALRDMEIKDVEEVLPKRKEEEKKKVVETAQELLKMMGKT